MPVDVASLVAPGRTAVLTMEVQRGTIGDTSPFDQLVHAASEVHLVESLRKLLTAARGTGVPVVHCTAEFRADLAGSGTNAPLLRAMTRHLSHIVHGSPGVELVDGLLDDRDLVCPRLSGVSPFTGTSLDVWLRNLGVSTVVASGVSVNLALIGLCIEAVNLGYNVVLPLDAIAGFPADYVDAVVANTLSLLALRTTVDELVAAWNNGAAPHTG